MRIAGLSFAVLMLFMAGMANVDSARAENASSPLSEVFKELPTPHCLGVRWKIKGDANKNALIEVQYRKHGPSFLEYHAGVTSGALEVSSDKAQRGHVIDRATS
jgi:hypothetical protein